MATLKYKGWSQPAHDVLVLDGMSIGNGVSAPFSDTLRVVRLTACNCAAAAWTSPIHVDNHTKTYIS